MKFKFKSKLQYKALIDLTSLIDLLFLLVIFFMVTSSLGSESTITVHLPKAVQSGEYKKSDLIVSVNKENKIFINDKLFKDKLILNHLKKMKKKLKPDSIVVIRGDKKSSYERIVKVMDLLNRAGIPKFMISTVK
jgi:biopolymer transport protein ExbD